MKKCGYCGRENEEDRTHCSECATPFPGTEAAEQAVIKKKSKTLAVILAVMFGPLGLLYLGGEGLIIVIFVVGIGFFLFPLLAGAKTGLLVSLLARVASATYAAKAVDVRNGITSNSDEALELLNEAARLENRDMNAAIIKYQEVVEQFPNSRSEKEARRNIETLQKAIQTNSARESSAAGAQ